MKTIAGLVLALVMASAAGVAGQNPTTPPQKPPATPAQPPAQPPPVQKPPSPTPPRPARAATATRLSMTVFVSDTTGAPLPGVRVKAEGPIPREGVTSREGTVKFLGLRAGEYRLHLEADNFVTLERDVAVKGASEVEVSLSRAPAPPKQPEPPPAPKPAPAVGAPLPPADPNATIEVVSVVDWLAKNKLERSEPRKEGVVARSAGEAAALLQVREALRDRSHPDADEVIYVINGSASLTSKGRQQQIETGSLLLIPRGVAFTIENRGREPLWALSVLSPGAGR